MQLRLVADSKRKSVEIVLEEPPRAEKWAPYYKSFRDPYLHLTPEQYAQAAERNALRVRQIHTALKSWDFQTRQNFFAFGKVTFVEWTRALPESEKAAFINDVLTNYAQVSTNSAPVNTTTQPHTFHFYQMDIDPRPTHEPTTAYYKLPTSPQLSFVTFNNLTCVASNLCTITSANLFSNSYPNS